MLTYLSWPQESVNGSTDRSFPKNLLSAATVCAPAGEATPQRAIESHKSGIRNVRTISNITVVRSQSHSPAEAGLGWCSLKHFRVIYGSGAVSKAPHLHAGPYGARVPALEVAQMHVVSQLPLQRPRFQLSIGRILHFKAHHRFDRKVFGETRANGEG